ncbi:hypothetical protein QOT17_011743 [Balamuthia mandrillaris]
MLSVGELPRILEILQEKRERYYTLNRGDNVALQLYAKQSFVPEPLEFGPYEELPKDDDTPRRRKTVPSQTPNEDSESGKTVIIVHPMARRKGTSPASPQPRPNNNQQQQQQQQQTLPLDKQKEKDTPSLPSSSQQPQQPFVFAKEKLPSPSNKKPSPSSAAQTSALTQLMGPRFENRNSLGLGFRNSIGKTTEITVFFGGKAYRVSISDSFTGHQLLDMMRQQQPSLTEEEDKLPHLPPQNEPYVIKMAEPDGSVDDDDLALNLQQPIRNFGRHFCIMSANSSTSDGKGDTKELFKVRLGGSEYRILKYDPELTVRELLKRITARRGLMTSEFFLRIVGENQPLELDEKLSIISDPKKQELELVEKKREEPTATINKFNWTEALRFKQYRVRRKGFGNKQDRWIGIDAKEITVSYSKGKNKEMVKKSYPFSDVKKINLESKAMTFVLQFEGDQKAETYEAGTQQDAGTFFCPFFLCIISHLFSPPLYSVPPLRKQTR